MEQRETFKDYYRILQVHMMADQDIIRSAFKQLSKKFHPDNGGTKQVFHQIQEAYEVLGDADKRNVYNHQWRQHLLSYHPEIKTFKGSKPYDLTFKPALSCVDEYLFFIRNKEYDSAYDLLSNLNQKTIYKKDFRHWQELIGQVHELMDFDTVVESFGYDDVYESQLVQVRVKIKEVNHLINRLEEDYFIRKVIQEEGDWKILLPKIDLKNIIKKYKKLIGVNKKNRKLIDQKNKRLHEDFAGKEVSFSVFRNQVEYEYLRFKRYGRYFSILKIQFLVTDISLSLENRILQVLGRETRDLDAYTKYDHSTFLVLLPETGYKDSFVVVKKLDKMLRTMGKDQDDYLFHIQNYDLDQAISGAKEFLDEVLK